MKLRSAMAFLAKASIYILPDHLFAFLQRGIRNDISATNPLPYPTPASELLQLSNADLP
jgi:hypothetical protein